MTGATLGGCGRPISFSRIATFKERNDRDLFRQGIMREFGG